MIILYLKDCDAHEVQEGLLILLSNVGVPQSHDVENLELLSENEHDPAKAVELRIQVKIL